MYFSMKNYLKSSCNHAVKHTLSICTINLSQPCTINMGRNKHNEFLLFKNAYKMVIFLKKFNYFIVFNYFDM